MRFFEANQQDIENARVKELSPSLIDRLTLNKERVEIIANSLENVASLPDPIGELIDSRTRPNGLKIERVRVPLGVVGIIYESRPNVTADSAALCLKSSNASILRSGSESYHSSHAIMRCLKIGIRAADLPDGSVQLIPTKKRKAVGMMLKMNNFIDILIPRGGRSLIERVQNESNIPVIAHLDGNCHTYIHADANRSMASKIVYNAKLRRTSICGATESLLIDRTILKTHLPEIIEKLSKNGCEIVGDKDSQAIDSRIKLATKEDWGTEYLNAKISIKVVENIDSAICHIENFGSQHTDCIITENEAAAKQFLSEVDSAIVMHNTSTQFCRWCRIWPRRRNRYLYRSFTCSWTGWA